MKNFILLSMFLFAYVLSSGQSDVLDYTELSEEETQAVIADRNELEDELRIHNADLNSGDHDILINAGLLNEKQASALKDHLAAHGPLLNLNELQSIEGFDLVLIRKLLPFVRLSRSNNQKGIHLDKIRHSITLKTGLRGELTDTILKAARTIASYRFRSRQINAGILAENDAGESYSIKSGSFASGFIQLKRTGILKNAVLGDHNISAGQGLNIWTGYSIGGRADALSARKSQSLLTPHTGTDENRYFRGMAVHLEQGRFQLLLFASYRSYLKIKAPPIYSRLASPPFKQLNAGCSGGNLFFRNRKTEAGITFCSTSLDQRIESSEEIYKSFHFKGRKSNSASAYYSLFHRNMCFFGENAIADHLRYAGVNGALISAGKSVSVAIRHNFTSPGFNSFYSSWNGIRRDARNENSLTFILNIACRKNIKLSGTLRSYKYPWLNYGEENFTTGSDLYLSATRELPDKRFLKVVLALAKPSRSTNDLKLIRNTTRISYGLKVSPFITFLSTASYSSSKSTGSSSHGLSGEIHYEPARKIRLVTALASIHSDKSMPLYFAEEGVSSFANPLLSNGDFTRFYLLGSYSLHRYFQMTVKAEQTFRKNEISIPGLQLMLRFNF